MSMAKSRERLQLSYHSWDPARVKRCFYKADGLKKPQTNHPKSGVCSELKRGPWIFLTLSYGNEERQASPEHLAWRPAQLFQIGEC